MVAIESQLRVHREVLVASLVGWTADSFSLFDVCFSAGIIMLFFRAFFKNSGND